jgi:Leucine-rich repeat (LRR) protein
VLDLEDTKGLRDHHLKHIGKLLHLRYLSLRGCDEIYHLPDSLGNLRELLTLDVRGTDIIKLPKSIMNLQKLCNLRAGKRPSNETISYEGYGDEGLLGNRAFMVPFYLSCTCLIFCAPWVIDDADGFSRRDVCTAMCCSEIPSFALKLDDHGVLVPRGIRKLKALRTLGTVNIARWGKTIMQDIRRLTQLRKLSVTGVNKENGQELCSAIVCLSRLESLLIRSEGKPGLSGCLDGEFSFSESLQKLKLYGNLVKLPEWIRGLKNLVKLKLRSCRITEHDDAMQVLGNLPSLASLHLLLGSFQGGEVDLSFCSETFQSLVVLELESGRRVKSVKFEERATPKLELVSVLLSCVNSSSLLGLQNLTGLKEVVLPGGRSEEMEYVRAELALHPNRPVVRSS